MSLALLLIVAESNAAQRQYVLRVTHHDEIEPILANLRTSGCILEDLQIQQADLEDVFLQIMGSDKGEVQ